MKSTAEQSFNAFNSPEQHSGIDLEKDKIDYKNEEEILKNRDVVSRVRLKGGSNKVSVLELKDDGKAVFKPRSGELPKNLVWIESGSFCERERAAYLIDQYLGFDIVPPTVIRTIDNDVGSLQEFVPAKTAKQVGWEEVQDDMYEEDRFKIWIFDLLVYNVDRSDRNILVQDDRLYAIDNGLIFGKRGYLFTYEDYWDEEVPRKVTELIEEFVLSKDMQEALRYILSEIIDSYFIDQFLQRLDMIWKQLSTTGSISSEIGEILLGEINSE